jgi:hypothetical protein
MTVFAFAKAAAAALLLTTSAGAAAAEDITLSHALDGATLHAGGVDMSVYYTENASVFQVTGTYLRKGDTGEPGRVILRLADGDTASFGLPGGAPAAYTFARTGSDVTVTARPLWTVVAAR